MIGAVGITLLLAGCTPQQSTKDACGQMTIAVTAIGNDLTAAEATIGTDQAKGQKQFRALADKFTASEKKITNSDVKPKADKIESNLHQLVTAINLQVSKPSTAHSKSVTTLSTKLQKALTDLGTVCTG